MMIARGVLQGGVHFFKPHGLGSRPIFAWRAIADYVEGTATKGGGRWLSPPLP